MKIKQREFGRDLLGFRSDINKLADSLFNKVKRPQTAAPKVKKVIKLFNLTHIYT